jgi:hypothetical protein
MRRVVCVGAPFVPFNLPVAGRSPQRAFAGHPFKPTRTALSFQMCCDRCGNAPLETRVQPIQASPCTQDLRSGVVHIFRRLRFPAMLISPLPFGVRSGGCPKRRWCSQPSALQGLSHKCRNGAHGCAHGLRNELKGSERLSQNGLFEGKEPLFFPRDAQRAVVFKRSGSRGYFKAFVLL